MQLARRILIAELAGFAALLVVALALAAYGAWDSHVHGSSELFGNAGKFLFVFTVLFGALPVALIGAPGYALLHARGLATWPWVLLLGAAALITIEALSDGTLPKVVPWRLISVCAAVLGTVLIIQRALTEGSSAPGANVGPGWSGFLLFLAAIAVTTYAIRAFRDSEEKIDLSDVNPDD